MPKIGRHMGPSDALDLQEGSPDSDEETVEPGEEVETEDEGAEATPRPSDDDAPEDGQPSYGEASGDVVPTEQVEGDDTTESDTEPADAALPRPAANANKADWLAYAKWCDPTNPDLDNYTRNRLVQDYGG
jgi:hypothetical protein